MDLSTFLARLDRGERVGFADTMEVVDRNYEYRATTFYNGLGLDQLVNSAGENEGSCKIFYFAKLHQLSKDTTLALFGDFYWVDVVENPEAENHANIRTFMKYGWNGIEFEGVALKPFGA